MEDLKVKYLQRLAELYPTIAAASTEIINLEAIRNLPKGTEHFLTDIHGEYEAFTHVLKNGSGSVKKKIDEVFGRTLSESDKSALATLIYYPNEKIALVRQQEKNMDDWYKITLYRLIEICKKASSKYTRSKVRKELPKDYAYVIEELITEKPDVLDKEAYYNSIVDTIIDIQRAEDFIVALCHLIQQLVVDHLHILGDIYDRGPGPERIMDRLMNYHSLDICWGNHDIVWMGAAAGSFPCIATVLRICARYGNLDILEDGYGINMIPLATFASRVYGDDPCTLFKLKGENCTRLPNENELNMRMHKAISIIQFKLEGQLFRERPEFQMQDRMLLDKIDYERGVIRLGEKEYTLLDHNFPTIDPADPYRLTEDEMEVMERMQRAFTQCEKLYQHMNLLLNKGKLYFIYNDNLLYHGCIPLTEDGDFLQVDVYGKKFCGRALYDELEKYVRKAFFAVDEEERKKGRDIIYWIWCSPQSPLFGKDKMATFERYFIREKETHVEKKNPYYRLLDNEEVMDRVLEEFGLGSDAHIVNGHVPVMQSSGESPVKCGGKVLIIDGGFSKAYQGKTGIAGYTLIYNSYGMQLVALKPFTSTEDAVRNETDIHGEKIMVMNAPHRLHVSDTDIGRRLKERIDELKELLEAYRSGAINEIV
ncbi:MAG: fructose-1,6-bisphosphatase [Bilifractor sp.]|nr:fructose-1,6-bisphosphatase [Lachnospiraceae bacterium]MDY2837299.1 fructose-1,6-bisphosphatase [Bilifractor sp.]